MTDIVGFSNKGRTTINMPPNGLPSGSGSQTLTVQSAAVLPPSGKAFDIIIEQEYITVPAAVNTGGPTYTGVLRGQYGTSPVAHVDQTPIIEVVTAYELGQFVQFPQAKLTIDQDVSITTPNNGDVLTYDTATSLWKNKPSGSNTLSGDTDVTLTSLAKGDILVYDSSISKWKNYAAGTSGYALISNGAGTLPTWQAIAQALSGLSDVTITSIAKGDILVYDAALSKWKNYAAGTSGYALISNGPTTLPTWQAIATSLATLTDVVETSLANGDILVYESATGKWKNYADGTAGQVLTANGAGQKPTYQTQATTMYAYWDNISGTGDNGTLYASWSTISPGAATGADGSGHIHIDGTHSSRIDFDVAGIYTITCGLLPGIGDNTTTNYFRMLKNGGTTLDILDSFFNSSTQTYKSLSWTGHLNAGDYIEFSLYMGGTVSISYSVGYIGITSITLNGQLAPGTYAALTDVALSGLQNGQVPMYNTGTSKWNNANASLPLSTELAYWTKLAALLEPDAIEPVQYGTFTYTISGSATKFLLAAWDASIASNGRFELRDVRQPIPLRGVTVNGLASQAIAVFLDPTKPTYADAMSTYYSRLDQIATSATKYVYISTTSTIVPLLPGPYGSIITGATCFDFAWIILSPFGLNLYDEVADTTTQRFAHQMRFPINKNFAGGLQSSFTGAAGNLAGVSYIILPSTWSAVTDPLAPYSFRDDFMGATLDTTTKWTRVQSTAGNVEIDTNFQWLNLVGNSTWGANGLYTQSSWAHSSGKKMLVDVYVPQAASQGTNQVMVGWMDALGVSYTNFAHGINFGNNGSGGSQLQAYENGTARGAVGSGFTQGAIYRLRFTLGASSCTYEIQGGPEYPPIGGTSWTNITPGTSSSSTTPLRAGASVGAASTPKSWISDVRVY